MYNYKEQKHTIFSEEGQEMFLGIRDNVKLLIETAGAARMDN